MSEFTALYRKYRPTTFDDVKGQEHIVTTLKNQIKSSRIGHAYLFNGTRGTGKTTVAKIFAKAVNCENPVNGNPCGQCSMCRQIAADASFNVIEIDAASNNGVENIRQIKDEVSYTISYGKYKVYIIDEVHMLSNSAFNALLKTLEEPPAHVIFILATTEIHKIPATILSRCQRYDFRRISINEIAERLREVVSAEGINADDNAIRYISRVADGSMRDALSILDQCIDFHPDEVLTLDMVLEMLGAEDQSFYSDLLHDIIKHDVMSALSVIEQVFDSGKELEQFANDFAWYLRNLLFVKNSDNLEDILDMSKENIEILKEDAKLLDEDMILYYIKVFSELYAQMKVSTQKRIILEAAISNVCRYEKSISLSDIGKKIDDMSEKIKPEIRLTAGNIYFDFFGDFYKASKGEMDTGLLREKYNNQFCADALLLLDGKDDYSEQIKSAYTKVFVPSVKKGEISLEEMKEASNLMAKYHSHFTNELILLITREISRL